MHKNRGVFEMVKKLWIMMITIIAISVAFANTNKFYTLTDVSKHFLAVDCWIVIDKKVYDVSSYSQEHKSKQDYDYSKFCGKDASVAWLNKDGKNEPHKRKSNILLKKFLVGTLQ
jgi:cytochrome b involved in lipid metabolism